MTSPIYKERHKENNHNREKYFKYLKDCENTCTYFINEVARYTRNNSMLKIQIYHVPSGLRGSIRIGGWCWDPNENKNVTYIFMYCIFYS